jgi:hypothetical protein
VAGLAQLIRVGGKLAVLGVEDGRRAMGWWHVVRPGSAGPPDSVTGLTYGKALCKRTVVSNGYASDWRPPQGTLCPACAEQV